MRMSILVSITLLGCASKNSERERNHEAIILHNSMERKAALMAHHLDKLKSDTSFNQDSVSLFTTLLSQWRNDLVEVPGNNNHDHQGHVHDHNTVPDVTEVQMLEIQRELDERLSRIGKRISQLKPKRIK